MKNNIKKVVILLLVFIFLFLIIKIIKTIIFTKKVSSNKESHMYSVLVSDNAIKKRELKNIPIGYYAQDNIPLNYNSKYKYVPYKDIDSLYNGLLYGEVGAIIIEDNLRILASNSDETLRYRTTIIDTYEYSEKVSDVSKNIDITSEQFIIYISGVDAFGSITNVARSDVNILATINPSSHKILLISIPRDYYLLIPSKNKKDKLTHIGIYGIKESINAIESLLNININYYVKVNFNSLIDIVDMIGGLNVYSSNSFTSIDGNKYNMGYNKLTGEEVLSFVRERYSFPDGDRTRGINQEEVLKSIVNEVTSAKILLKYDSFLEKLSNKIETNMKESEIISLIKLQMSENINWDISTYNLDGTNSLEYTYTYPKEKLYVMIPNNEMVREAKIKIDELGD